MSDRKAELERKKAKLAALREEKERRRREKELKEVEEAALRAVHGSSNEADVHQEVNKVLSEVGILPVSDVVDKISSLPPSLLEPSSGPGSLSDARAGAAGLPRKKANLTIANVHAENIAPKEQVIYDKETQTSGNTVPTSSHGLDYYDDLHYTALEWDDEFEGVLTYDAMGGEGDGEDDSFGPHYDTPPVSYKKLLPPGVLHPGMPDVRAVKPAVTTEEAADQAAKDGDGDGKKQLRELSEEEKKMIVLSDDFQKFFDKTARYVERALAEDADIFVDYTGVLEHDGDADDRSGMQLSLNRSFSDDRWSKGRVITSMDWSTQFPELLVASYSSRGGAVDIGGGGTGAGGNDPDGVALVWNTRFKRTTPEYIFHCQSPVMSVAFAKFHPNLIIGGTYSGRIVLWDNRVNKRTPVQRSTLSAAAHTHPVYCLNVVGTQHAHNLVSVSTDGRLCGWGSLDMLAQPPQETLELHQTQRQGKPVAATALAFPKSSPVVAGGGLDAGLTNDNYFLVGSEEGTVYSGCRHGSKTGILESYEGHYGPVTGLDPHPGLNGLLSAGGNAAGGSSPDLSHLFLTSSFDWTVKLWSSKDRRPIYSFEGSNDYVYDVAWSPVHPAVFATVDGTGRLDLWNLNYDTEVPAASVVVDNGAHALNCVSWTQSGQHIVVGDQGGKLWVYDLGDQLAVPRSDEWNQMALTVQELRNSRTEDDYLPSGTGASSSGASSLSSSVGSSMVGSVGAASMTIPGYSGSPGGLATSPHQSMLTPSRQSGPTSLGGSPLSLR